MRYLHKFAILLLGLAVVGLAPVHAQLPQYLNFCQDGGQVVVTQGLNSTTFVQASYPRCTVTVFNAGTTTVSTIFSTTGGAPLSNPFTANADGSFLFFASSSLCYDVNISGGSPNTMPAPFTYSNSCLGTGGGGGGGGTVTLFSATNSSNGLLTLGVTNPATTPNLTVSLPSTTAANTIWGNCTGAPASSAYCLITTSMLPFSYTGNTTKLATSTGTLTSGDCLQVDANGNLVDAGFACSNITINSTNNFIPKRLSATAFVNSCLSDTGSILSCLSEPFSFLSGTVVATNPQTGSDPSDRRLVDFTATTDSTTSNPNFSDENVVQITQNSSNGQALYGNGTNAKKTFLPLLITANEQGSGQRILQSTTQNCYGMGDCADTTHFVTFAGADVAGDEGQALGIVSLLSQQPHLNLTTISGTPTRTSCNTTLTQSVTASRLSQTVTVASTAGCNVNDWVVIGQEVATNTPNESPMLITAVGGGTLTGVITGNYPNGTTVTPAVVVNTTGDGFPWGQDRVVVDLSGSTYSTGTVSSISGGSFTGSGTTWTTGIVGGNSTIVGCIALTADDFNGAPFNGSGENGNLKSWYQILPGGLTNTNLGIYTTSTAGDAAYHGNGPGAGGYIIRPCAKVLHVTSNSSQVILETNSFTWTNNDSLEEIVSPYPDVSGYQYHSAIYTAGGARRAFIDIRNTGARTITAGMNIQGNMSVGGGADTTAFGVGITIANAGGGIAITQPTGNAIGVSTNGVNQTGRYTWNAGTPYIGINATSSMLEIQTTAGGSAGDGDIIFSSSDPITSAGIRRGVFNGMFDVHNFNNSVETRLGIFAINNNTWFFKGRAPSNRYLDVFNNNNGGGEGSGFGAVATFDGSNGRLGINQTAPGATLDVGGTGTFSGGVGPKDGSFGSSATNTSAACETSFGITTLSVAGTTTDTGLNCLPLNSIIDAVVYRITTTITTAASFTVGDATTAVRFCATQSTLTAGTTGTCFVQADQTGAAGPRQTAAAKVRVTTNVNPGAGAIRLIVYYHTWTPPTS